MTLLGKYSWSFLVLLGILVLQTTALKAHGTVPQVIHIGNGAEPKDLDPQTVTGIPEYHILLNLFEPLVIGDPKDLKPIPGAAESWKISKDGKVYTFKLRKNAKWSNGDAVTANDFIYAWVRLLTPATASEYAYQAHYIKNGKDFNTGKITDASLLGLKALDPHTLEITLENPTPFFLGLLSHHSLFPVHKATVEKFGARWTRPENMVSNGAFKLKRWETNRIIVVEKNPNYWDKDTVKLTEAHFHPIEKADTEEKMFRAGELDVTEQIPLEKMDFWKKDTTGSYLSHPYLGSYYYWFNCTKPPFNNKLVRQALSLAIDREKIVKYITKGGQLPGTSFTPPGTAGYNPPAMLPKDLSQVKKAKELLAKAGYPDGKGFPKADILYNTSESHKKVAEAFQQMWKENLGIHIGLYNQEWKVYLDSQQNKDYQLSRAGWIGDYNDPNTFLDMLTSDNGNNRSGWGNKSYDDFIAAAAKEMNAKKRFELFKKAETILLEELPLMPIYIYTRNYLMHSKVRGWYPNIKDEHNLKFVSISAK